MTASLAPCCLMPVCSLLRPPRPSCRVLQVGDAERGVGLEMSLSKLLFAPAAQHVQIVGMSATSERGRGWAGAGKLTAEGICVPVLADISAGFFGAGSSPAMLMVCPSRRHSSCPAAVGGLEHLRAWLRAELFLTNFRPVPLSEHAVFRGKVYEKILKEVCRQGRAHRCVGGSVEARPTRAHAGPEHSMLCFLSARSRKRTPSNGLLSCAAYTFLPSALPVRLQELQQLPEGHAPLREAREIDPSDGRRDADRLVPLVAEVTSQGHSVLVFW